MRSGGAGAPEHRTAQRTRITQAEHTLTLAGHGRKLDEHSRILADHTHRLDKIDGKLGTITVGVHAIGTMLRRLTDDGDAATVLRG